MDILTLVSGHHNLERYNSQNISAIEKNRGRQVKILPSNVDFIHAIKNGNHRR